MGDLVRMVVQRASARFLESGVEHKTVSALDHARTDGQTQLECPRIVQQLQAIGQVAMSVPHRGFIIRCPDRHQMLRQGFNRLLDRSSSQPLLLGPSPHIGLGGSADWRRGTRILAEMEEIAQKGGLLPKHFPGLQWEPFRPVSNRMDATVQSSTGLPRTVTPAAPLVGHAPEGSPVQCGSSVFGLRRDQLHLLPLARTFALP